MYFFDLLLHLFLSANILKPEVTSVVNWYTVSLKEVTDIAQCFTAMGLFKMEVTKCKYEVQVLCLQYTLVPKCENHYTYQGI